MKGLAKDRSGFTLIELLIVIAIIAILAVVVVLTLNPAELLRQSRDANRVSDMASLTNALNLYTADQGGIAGFSLGTASDTYVSIFDTSATSTAGDQCQALGLPSLSTSTGQVYQCNTSSTYRNIASGGWMPVNLTKISAGSPIASLPVDPINQTTTGLYYAYNTNGSQFEVTANLESQKYKAQYANTAQTNGFPEVISGGTQNISALYSSTGLVGYWPLNEGMGSSTIDASGNGNGGTWNGTSTNGSYYTSGKVGTYAGNFNGINNYIQTPTATASTSINFAGSITMSAWVFPTADSNYDTIMDEANRNFAYWLTISNPSSVYVVIANAGPGGIGISTPWKLNAWNFVTVTANGSVISVYLNGTFDGSVSTAVLPGVANSNLDIGADSWNNNYYFPGSIDDVRVYSRVLSPAEILALYNAEK